MSSMVEIRWHGRGGQGAKTASLLLAETAFDSGKFVQGFPEYGPERMGAPITAYNRISDERSSLHSNIYEPDYVVVVDATLLTAVSVTSGLKKEGAIIVNTQKSPEEIKPLLEGYEGRVYTIDASSIAEDELGNRSLSNTSMLGAVITVSKVLPVDKFMADVKKSLDHKFAQKPHVIEKNMKALERGIKEVKE